MKRNLVKVLSSILIGASLIGGTATTFIGCSSNQASTSCSKRDFKDIIEKTITLLGEGLGSCSDIINNYQQGKLTREQASELLINYSDLLEELKFPSNDLEIFEKDNDQYHIAVTLNQAIQEYAMSCVYMGRGIRTNNSELIASSESVTKRASKNFDKTIQLMEEYVE